MHPRLVEHIVSDNNGVGYAVTHGFMWNGADRMATLSPEDPKNAWDRLGIKVREFLRSRGWMSRYATGRLPFHYHSGSCGGIRFDCRPDTPELPFFPLFSAHHRELTSYFEAGGRPLSDIPFFTMIYLMGQETNMHAVRGKSDRKGLYLKRHACSKADVVQIKRTFGL